MRGGAGLKEGNDCEDSRTPLAVRCKDMERKMPPCENHFCCLSGFERWSEIRLRLFLVVLSSFPVVLSLLLTSSHSEPKHWAQY